MDNRAEVREFLTTRREKITPEPGSDSAERLGLLASWAASEHGESLSAAEEPHPKPHS